METRQRNLVALGLLVAVAGVLFVWGLFFLLGDPFWERGTSVVMIMEDGAKLRRGDRIHLHGVEVGTVREVTLHPPRQVAVQLRFKRGILLPADTRAAVRTDVFGTGTIELLPGVALVALEDGDSIAGGTARALPDLMADLGGQAGVLLASADSLLSPRAVADLHATAAVLPAGALALRDALAELQRAAAALRRGAEGIEGARTGEALGQTLGELQGSARAITGAAQEMERSLSSFSSVMDKIDRGDGSLGRFVNDSTFYQELNHTLRAVRALATDVRERPKRYMNISVF